MNDKRNTLVEHFKSLVTEVGLQLNGLERDISFCARQWITLTIDHTGFNSDIYIKESFGNEVRIRMLQSEPLLNKVAIIPDGMTVDEAWDIRNTLEYVLC